MERGVKKMFENHMELRFRSISQNEALARSVAAAFAAQLNPTIEELTDIRTAVSEAVTNAIIHGYDNACQRERSDTPMLPLPTGL